MKALSMGLKKKYNKFTFYIRMLSFPNGQMLPLKGKINREVKPAGNVYGFYNFTLDKTVDLCYNTKRAKGNACGACF